MPDTLVIFGTEYNNVAGIIAKDDNDTDQTYVKAPTGNINITTAGSTDVTNYATATVASGSATPASSISGTSATVSTGTNTLTLSKTVSNTPQVSAGYVSSGTAGNTNVSLTANVTTKAAATIYPSASDQSIASGTYLTGAQTIKGVTYSNLTADNIKKNVMVTIGDSADADRILSVTGTYEGGGGGGGIGDLLSTTTIGAYSTSTTSSTNMNISTVATNINAYDLLLVETSVDTEVANRHMATVAAVFLLNSTNAATKNASAIATVKWNAKLSSSSVTQTTSSTTAYGIYPNSCTITTASNGTATFPMYSRYNSTRSGTINGNYKTRIYGVKLCELIGG